MEVGQATNWAVAPKKKKYKVLEEELRLFSALIVKINKSIVM
jgi:hypothetical protein